MCLIALAWNVHPDYPLVIAANRDEFHDRPAAAAGYWAEAPQVFGGRDLSQGGSWLALSTAGRLACVTNVRRMQPPNPAAPSRGRLVASFVQGRQSAADFADRLAAQAQDYAGFNLLLWDGSELRYVGNQPRFASQAVAPGVHALSNASLNTPWPKARRLRRAMEDWLAGGKAAPDALLRALGDDAPATDAELPDTGVGLELERLLSAPFIRSPRYGTRASTALLLGRDGRAQFVERRFDAAGRAAGETRAALGVLLRAQ